MRVQWSDHTNVDSKTSRVVDSVHQSSTSEALLRGSRPAAGLPVSGGSPLLGNIRMRFPLIGTDPLSAVKTGQGLDADHMLGSG
jgi:hypothetical protein